MTAASAEAAADPAWVDALWAAALFAVDPPGLGGIVLRAQAGPVRDRWAALQRDLLPPDTPWRRLPTHTADDRLLGGLDLAATRSVGRSSVLAPVLRPSAARVGFVRGMSDLAVRCAL